MDADIEAVITPVCVKIENESETVELGPATREALRIEQVQLLRAALDEVCTMADAPLDEMNRAQLEDLGRALRVADKASGAIWWLIPADVYTEDE
jgi:hypothetical protein